jgi:hypothetical protein
MKMSALSMKTLGDVRFKYVLQLVSADRLER